MVIAADQVPIKGAPEEQKLPESVERKRGSDESCLHLSCSMTSARGTNAIEEAIKELRKFGAGQDLVQAGTLPKIIAPLSSEQRKVAEVYQNALLNPLLLTQIMPKEKQLFASVLSPEKLKDLKAANLAAEIGKEQEKGEFGFWSKLALTALVDFYQTNLVKDTVLQLASRNLVLPAGLQAFVPIPPGMPMRGYLDGVADGTIKVNIGIDLNNPLNQESSRRFGTASVILLEAQQSIQESRIREEQQTIKDMVVKHNLPKQWLERGNQDEPSWRVSTEVAIDTFLSAQRTLHLIDAYKLQIPPPPGCVRTAENGVTHYKLDLPSSPRLDDPETIQKLGSLALWNLKTKEKVQKYLAQQDVPSHQVLYWGDTPVPAFKDEHGKEVQARVLLDSQGRMIKIIDPTKPIVLEEGQTTKPINLLEQRLKVEKKIVLNTEGGAGDTPEYRASYVVHQTVQAQSVPWFGYENNFATNQGLPANIQNRDLRDGQSVDVKRGNDTESMLAEDLQDYCVSSAIFHYGENIATAVMDASVFVDGGVDIGLVYRGGTMLYKGIGLASHITERMLLIKSAEAAFKETLAFSSPNAHSLQTESGRKDADRRNFAFLALLGVGLTEGGNWNQIRDFANLSAAHRLAQHSMLVSTTPGLAGIFIDAFAAQKLDARLVQLTATADYRRYESDPESILPSFPQASPSALQDNATLISQAEKMKIQFLRGIPEVEKDSKKAVENVFDQVERVLQGGSEPRAIEMLKVQLAENIFPDKWGRRWADVLNGFPLSPIELRSLCVPEAAQDFNHSVQSIAEPICHWRDQNLSVASQLGLLLLSQSGVTDSPIKSPPDWLKTPDLEIRKHEQAIQQAFRDPKFLIERLQAELGTVHSDARGMVIADYLFRNSGISAKQYLTVLENVLLSGTAASRDKAEALERSRGVLPILQVQEEQRGVTEPPALDEFAKTLEQVAAKDKNVDIRALATLTQFSLDTWAKETDDSIRLLQDSIAVVKTGTVADGAIFKKIAAFILEKASQPAPAVGASTAQPQPTDAELFTRLSAIRASVSLSLRNSFGELGAPVTADLLMSDNLAVVARASDLLSVHRVYSLKSNDPNLYAALQARVLRQLSEQAITRDPKTIKVYLDLATKLFQNSPEQEKRLVLESLEGLAKASMPTLRYTTANILSSYAAIGGASAISFLEDIATDRRIDGNIRLAALQEWKSFPDTRERIKTELTDETDPRIADVVRKLDGKDSTPDIPQVDALAQLIKSRYPDLASFNEKAKRELIDREYSYLSNEKLEDSVREIFKKNPEEGRVSLPLEEKTEAAQRDAFERIRALALSTKETRAVLEARLILADIVLGVPPFKPISSQQFDVETSYFGDPGGSGFQSTDTIVFFFRPKPLAADALKTLREIQGREGQGRDLVDLMINMIESR